MGKKKVSISLKKVFPDPPLKESWSLDYKGAELGQRDSQMCWVSDRLSEAIKRDFKKAVWAYLEGEWRKAWVRTEKSGFEIWMYLEDPCNRYEVAGCPIRDRDPNNADESDKPSD